MKRTAEISTVLVVLVYALVLFVVAVLAVDPGL